MIYKCPYCGSVEKNRACCSKCFEKITCRSSFYYNRGLEAAQVRNLSLASTYLNKAIMHNKYNIEARNLLGLICFEIGQVGDALKEWIISQSLKKQDNIAAQYIQEVQNNPKMLGKYKEAIMLYNKAIDYLKQQDVDMAMIRLKKVVSIHPKLVQAKVLLALCYMYDRQYYKANEQVKKVLVIDQGHKEALIYFKELSSEDTTSEVPYERQYPVKTSNHIKLGHVVDRGRVLRKYLIYFLIGGMGMFLVENYLIVPSKLKSYQDEKVRLQKSEEVLSGRIQSLSDEYSLKVEELQNKKKELSNKLATYAVQVDVLTQKEKLNQVDELVEDREYIEAAQILYQVSGANLNETDKGEFEALKAVVYPPAVDSIYSEGLKLYNRGNYVEATAEFELALLYEPSENMERKNLYYLGCSAMKSNYIEGAKKYFEKVVAEHTGTSEARLAQEKLEAMVIN